MVVLCLKNQRRTVVYLHPSTSQLVNPKIDNRLGGIIQLDTPEVLMLCTGVSTTDVLGCTMPAGISGISGNRITPRLNYRGQCQPNRKGYFYSVRNMR